MLSTSRLQALQVIVNVLRSDDFCVQRTYRREKGDETTRARHDTCCAITIFVDILHMFVNTVLRDLIRVFTACDMDSTVGGVE